MGKLKALLLTEGMHGMISQVEGMAKALNAEYSHKIVRLSFPWNLIPPKFTPISEIILKDKNYGNSNFGNGKKIIIEHTSINPNASPHVGRARNAIIWNSLVQKSIFLFT